MINNIQTFLLVISSLFSVAFSHTYLSSTYIDGQWLPEGQCVRPHPRGGYDSPIPLVSSPDMTCGWLPEASRPANAKCLVAAGSVVGIQWHHSSNAPGDDIIADTHKGPVLIYLAKSETGLGDVWFKVYEDGLVGGRWGVDRLLDNGGKVYVTIPSDIIPGNYLLRGEILALHGAYSLNGVQPYVGCVELTISSQGTQQPQGVSFPGYYKNTDPGMLLSIYQGITSYPIPGPAVYKSSSTSIPTAKPTSIPSSPVKVDLNVANEWIVSLAMQETSYLVQIKDNVSTHYSNMSRQNCTYIWASCNKIKFPLHLRLLSGNVELFHSITSPTPTTSILEWDQEQQEPLPSQAPTSKPSPQPEAQNISVYPGSSEWWLAVSVSGNPNQVAKVEVKDSPTSGYKSLSRSSWGPYILEDVTAPIKVPFDVKVTYTNGQTAIKSFSSFN